MEHVCRICPHARSFLSSEIGECIKLCDQEAQGIPPQLLSILLNVSHFLSHSVQLTCPVQGCMIKSLPIKALKDHWKTHVTCNVKCGSGPG
ncbi:hypothetical protein NCS56_00143700 [Fusarium sp. Ph1]|nr:hypothetical protein NCS56_00143700 [Fusarium sp. Ph1]